MCQSLAADHCAPVGTAAALHPVAETAGDEAGRDDHSVYNLALLSTG